MDVEDPLARQGEDRGRDDAAVVGEHAHHRVEAPDLVGGRRFPQVRGSEDGQAAFAGESRDRCRRQLTAPACRSVRDGVFLDGRDVTSRVRETDVSQAASRVSVHPEVREWMVARQRELGAAGGVVMEGRDIGTKVFPDADIKIFLDADPVTREKRRIQQEHSHGVSAESMAEELRERDRRDWTRATSPLEPAFDAVILDSTDGPARWFIDGGMTRGIPDAAARARTITVYTDVRKSTPRPRSRQPRHDSCADRRALGPSSGQRGRRLRGGQGRAACGCATPAGRRRSGASAA